MGRFDVFYDEAAQSSPVHPFSRDRRSCLHDHFGFSPASTLLYCARDVRVYMGEVDDMQEILMYMVAAMQIANAEYSTQLSHELTTHMAEIDLAVLTGFFLNPAFQRSWMILEMVLGRDVTLWSGEVDLSLSVAQSYIHFQNVQNIVATNTKGLELTRAEFEMYSLGIYNAHKLAKVKYYWEQAKPKSFIEVLSLFRRSMAKNPRDKVYSLLSLSAEHYRQNIPPTYAESSTLVDLFIRVANLAITSPSKEDVKFLLEHAGANETVSALTAALPSWIPDWTGLPCKPLDASLYRCSGPTSPEVRLRDAQLSPRCQTIVDKGYVLDWLIHIGPVWLYDNIEQPLPQFPEVKSSTAALVYLHQDLDRFVNVLAESQRPYPASDSTYQDALWQSLVCGQAWGERRAETSDQRHYLAFRKSLRLDTNESTAASENDDNDYPFRVVSCELMPGRRCGLTRSGYMGAFPNTTEKCDLVFILQGFNVPFVLRLVDEGNDTHRWKFKLIGPCYVHGIMDGELVQVGRQGDLETIKIRGQEMEDIEIV